MDKYLILTLLCLTSLAIVNQKVVRTVDYDNINTIVTTEIDIHNENEEGPTVKTYLIAVNASNHEHLVHLQVSQNKNTLKHERKGTQNGFVQYSVVLASPVEAGKIQKIKVEEVYTHQKHPFPKTMKILDTP